MRRLDWLWLPKLTFFLFFISFYLNCHNDVAAKTIILNHRELHTLQASSLLNIYWKTLMGVLHATPTVIFSVLGLVPNLMLEKRRREWDSHCLTGTTSYSLHRCNCLLSAVLRLQGEDDYQWQKWYVIFFQHISSFFYAFFLFCFLSSFGRWMCRTSSQGVIGTLHAKHSTGVRPLLWSVFFFFLTLMSLYCEGLS